MEYSEIKKSNDKNLRTRNSKKTTKKLFATFLQNSSSNPYLRKNHPHSDLQNITNSQRAPNNHILRPPPLTRLEPSPLLFFKPTSTLPHIRHRYQITWRGR